ncbi:hypothetical protein QCA50_014316 [Cerrena zonata]|uniref:NADAR domain-containing protein n=1 Tax=Cerrena zonata TaxID=2478898 RepID=A0AAW0FYT6_9APHY
MSPTTPTTPQTAIPIITSKVYTTQPIYSSGGSVQYRVEERRRTIYVTSDVPPNSQAMNELFTLSEHRVPEADEFDDDVNARRRTKSLEEREVHIYDHLASDQRAKADSRKTKRRSGHHKQSSSSSRHSYARTTPPTSPTSFSSLGQPWTMIQQPPILFYHKHEPHYGFTNFSAHEVVYNGKAYPTSEHLFQSFKFQGFRPKLAEHIRTCSDRPSMAFSEARRFQPEVRSDWKDVNIQAMDKALFLKFTQHMDLYEELLATGNAELVENSDKDAFWGCGADGNGRNELGKALVRLRTSLREKGQSVFAPNPDEDKQPFLPWNAPA